MVLHSAVGVESTGSSARIDAFLLDASQVIWTVLMDQTFRPAIWWGAEHATDAGADGMILLHAAVCIRPTGRG